MPRKSMQKIPLGRISKEVQLATVMSNHNLRKLVNKNCEDKGMLEVFKSPRIMVNVQLIECIEKPAHAKVPYWICD